MKTFLSTKSICDTKTFFWQSWQWSLFVIRRLPKRWRRSCQRSLSVIRRLFFDNLDNEVYLWYEDFLEDEDVLVNEVYLWYEDFLKDEDELVKEVYLWYEDFLDNLNNEVYLWYEDFLEDEDVIVNEVYLWYEDFPEDKHSLEDEDCIEEEGYIEDENCLCKDVCPLISCSGAILAYEDIITLFIYFIACPCPFFFFFFFFSSSLYRSLYSFAHFL